MHSAVVFDFLLNGWLVHVYSVGVYFQNEARKYVCVENERLLDLR